MMKSIATKCLDDSYLERRGNDCPLLLELWSTYPESDTRDALALCILTLHAVAHSPLPIQLLVAGEMATAIAAYKTKLEEK